MSDDQNKTSKSEGNSMFGRLAESLRDVIFEEDAPHASTAEQQAAHGESTPSVKVSANSNEKNLMQERLHQAVMARSTGFAQLISNMQALEPIIPDETSRLRAAFAVLQKKRAFAA